jgi:hypothetical protein
MSRLNLHFDSSKIALLRNADRRSSRDGNQNLIEHPGPYLKEIIRDTGESRPCTVCEKEKSAFILDELAEVLGPIVQKHFAQGGRTHRLVNGERTRESRAYAAQKLARRKFRQVPPRLTHLATRSAPDWVGAGRVGSRLRVCSDFVTSQSLQLTTARPESKIRYSHPDYRYLILSPSSGTEPRRTTKFAASHTWRQK